MTEPHECIVVGAGPAGLAAALYLARYRRRVLVLHDASSRALRAPKVHNVAGFPDGIAGRALVEILTRQVEECGGHLEEAEVISARKDGVFELNARSGEVFRARAVILATGVEHCEVELATGDHDEAVNAGTLRYCPICDGYEHQDMRISVLGRDPKAAAEALFLRQYSASVSILLDDRFELASDHLEQVERAGIEIHRAEGFSLHHKGAEIEARSLAQTLTFDVLYPALGCKPRSNLARDLGVEINDAGCIPARSDMETNVEGVFVAGDVLDAIDQMTVAIGQGAIAATSAHNWLRIQDGHKLT